jgi:hypothetical protein
MAVIHFIVIVMMMPLMVLIISVGARRGTETSRDPECNKSNKCSFHVSVVSMTLISVSTKKFSDLVAISAVYARKAGSAGLRMGS